MILSGITYLGWLHTVACLVALPSGAYALMARKGGSYHRIAGWCFAVAMLVQSLPVLAIYRFDIIPGQKPGPGHFGFFHWSALAVLVAVMLAIFGASRQRRSRSWAHIHAQAMLFSFYVLIGGLINEMLARIAPLRHLATALSPHAVVTTDTMLAQLLQTAVMLAWWGLIPLLGAQVAQRFPAPQQISAPGYPMRYSGGAFLACVGTCLVLGAFYRNGAWLSMALALGMTLGGFLLLLARRAVSRIWGLPSRRQIQVVLLAVGLEMVVFAVLAASDFFQRISPLLAWETALGLVGAHFLIMRWSHGPLMLRLGLSVLAWLGLGILLRLPLPLVAIGDGLIKLGFGLAMVEPLLAHCGYFSPRSANSYSSATVLIP